METLQSAAVPAGAVLKASDLVSDPHLSSREFLQEIEHPMVGKETLPGPNLKITGDPGKIRSPAPLFGQHTDEILRDLLNKSGEDIDSLRASGIVGGLPTIGATGG
jgi:crotonobetainyl-CoA:carnitine CoA-transferase CaiB-like acyl-CoA transferase